MKTFHRSLTGRSRTGLSAFTLPEVMISSAVLSLVLLAILSTHLAGLRMAGSTEARLRASQAVRSGLDRLQDEIRCGKALRVGNTAPAFAAISNGSPQEGNALEIYPSGDTNNFVRYFLDADAQTLMRLSSDQRSAVPVVEGITNSVVFRSETFRGDAETSPVNNRLIAVTFEFCEWAFPGRNGNAHYDSSRFQTRITRRSLE